MEVNRTSKAILFYCDQKTIKKQPKAQYKFAEVPNPLFQNRSPLFLLHLFFEEYLNPQVTINKTVNKHSVDYHPIFGNINTYYHISINYLGIYLSP